ncbi:MAG: dehydrogenase, partial [Deltaproteobacteria bacterium]
IRLNGWIHPPEKADSSNPIDYLVHVRKLALPLYPQFGLEPNVYYIPPIHVPIPYLRQMFGPGAEEAIAGYKAAFRDETVLGAFMLFGATDRWISRFAVGSGWATGYDDQGKELVKVPIKEPEFLRPFYDEKHEVYRHNLT